MAGGGFFGGGFFADAADYGLVEVIGAFLLGAIHDVESKFRLTLGAFADLDGEGATEVVFDISGFIAGFLGVPGENAQRGEIAWLSFRAAGAGNEILRVIAIGIGNAIQLKPSQGTHVRGIGAFPDSIRYIKGYEPPDDPAGDGNGLIA